jgi:hypothetical protein
MVAPDLRPPPPLTPWPAGRTAPLRRPREGAEDRGSPAAAVPGPARVPVGPSGGGREVEVGGEWLAAVLGLRHPSRSARG